MSNLYLDYYGRHRISPVRQDLGDFAGHVSRRTLLYRQLGLPAAAFRGARVLEVGPGGGYNSLVTAGFGPARYLLVEPNPTGHDEIERLFAAHDRPQPERFHGRLEELPAEQRFDIVLCENLIPGLDGRRDFVELLQQRVAPEGVLVVTCQDPVSMFFESIRRYIAVELIAGVPAFDEQVALLAGHFGSHTTTLSGMSRPLPDWVADNLLAPSIFNVEDYFSVADAVGQLGTRFFVHHLAPNLVPDARWYKQLPATPADYNAPLVEDFEGHRHNLIHYLHLAPPRALTCNRALVAACLDFARLARRHWREPQTEDLTEAIAQLAIVAENLAGLDVPRRACEDALALLKRHDFSPQALAKDCPQFRTAFGRGVQYLSLIRARDEQE